MWPTGRPRLFRRRELTVQSVLASACLPTIHHAVAIDGRAYWDGGFSANPDLVTLARESPVGDTLIVRLSPLRTDSVPASAREISARINQITFNQPMLRDIEVIETVRAYQSRWSRMANAADARLARHRFHLIEAGRFTSGLAPESKGKPDLELLTYLHGAGRSETEKWLARARAAGRPARHGRSRPPFSFGAGRAGGQQGGPKRAAGSGGLTGHGAQMGKLAGSEPKAFANGARSIACRQGLL